MLDLLATGLGAAAGLALVAALASGVLVALDD